MESATLPRASLVTLPRRDRSPRATWLMTVSSSVMLRCRLSLASWLLVAFETFAMARFKFSAISPSSSDELTSARARLSPAAKRSEKSVNCCTGLSTPLPSLHARNSAPATASASAIITAPLAPLGRAPKSEIDAPPDCRPALYANPRTANKTAPLTRTSVQILELSRDFMPSSQIFLRRFSSVLRRKSQILGPGNTSSNFRRSISSASRSS
jgi:hypothetical protein